MQTEAIVKMKNIKKQFKGFWLDIPELSIPKGFATALIGENGAGKSTLLNILAGTRLDYKGEIEYFNGEKDEKMIREAVGYTGSGNYFMPHWNLKTIEEVGSILFDGFKEDEFRKYCEKIGLADKKTEVSKMSDGMRMKAELASVWARDSKMLVLDEPASPLDPLMRDELCNMIREYLEEGNGEKSVFFSTHNISDMENVTDYAVIMVDGKIMEQGFVEELKEKYLIVKGETTAISAAKEYIIGIRENQYGFEGLCKAEDLEKLTALDVAVENPTLSQICVSVMKQYTKLKQEENG